MGLLARLQPEVALGRWIVFLILTNCSCLLWPVRGSTNLMMKHCLGAVTGTKIQGDCPPKGYGYQDDGGGWDQRWTVVASQFLRKTPVSSVDWHVHEDQVIQACFHLACLLPVTAT